MTSIMHRRGTLGSLSRGFTPTQGTHQANWGGGVQGGVEGYQGGGGLGGALAGFLGGLFGDGGGGGSEPPQGTNPVPGNLTASGGPCPQGQIRVGEKCINLPFHGAPGAGINGVGTPAHTATGEAVLGRFGVAMVPGAMQRTRLRCPRGMVLGMDDLCYNRRDLRKDERKWVPPRKPLLTGGELNAIRTAARAAGKLSRAKKSIQKASRSLGKAC